ncbi:hypothetical protein N0V91_007299 [Didymella pomorum]|uniref:Uncharacterized protein n=1 Tax=Didymella pomorum TaxID=749634 RepID=A0A9W9D6J3_9PLEO|nr:hypothetical protein N0V91_007299 [Didymella pomorum]
MPVKKKTEADAETAASGETKFSWTPENDRILLLLALGRATGPADYEKFVSALSGANFQGVRQRISKLRMEQKRKYEDMGWELTTEATAKAKAEPQAKAPAKRKDSADVGEGKAGSAAGETTGKPKAKKPRAKRSKDADEAGSGDGEGKTAEPKAKKPRAEEGEGKKKAAAVKEEVESNGGDEAISKEDGDGEAV